MSILDALRCFLALLLLPPAAVRASGVRRSQPANGTVHPSAATLAGCQKSCGNLSFDYPFGIGTDCFRTAGPDFELTCNNHRLFLHDGITEVIGNITTTDGFYAQDVDVSFSHSISLRYGVDVYYMSWDPGSSFITHGANLLFTGCDFDMYVLDRNTNETVGRCSVTCNDEDITNTVARHHCNGTGCCTVNVMAEYANGLKIKFVDRHKIRKPKFKSRNNNPSSIWETISVTAYSTKISWGIIADETVDDDTFQNRADYACLSHNSMPQFHGENSYYSYSCHCSDGYKGNPYITDGCSHYEDVDQSKIPGQCHGICHNTKGSQYCTECPSKMVYDIAKIMCTSTKEQNLVLGISIMISAGFGILLLIIIVIIFVRCWKKDIQKKLRRRYFRQNQGLLLQQLISTDENASDNTKIFSLKELEKATNNFDPTRIVGRGGHGMVYKGILSDQRVVAIKKSKVIEKVEIS